MDNELGKYMRKIRGKRSLREMERITGISYTYLSNLEKGKDPRTGKEIAPSIDILEKLSSSLNIPKAKLMMMAGFISLKDWYLTNLDNSKSFDTNTNEYAIAKIQGYKSVEEMNREKVESAKILSTGYAIKDLKVFLELKVKNEIGSIIYPVYNGHKLTKEECQRILSVLSAMFPQYLSNKKDD